MFSKAPLEQGMKRNRNFLFENQRIQLFAVLSCCSLAVWTAFARLAVPPLIQSVYRGESFSLLNRLIQGQANAPVEYYLEKWDVITGQVLLGIFIFWLAALATTSKPFSRRFVGEATPGTLGAIRMWVCTILLLTAAWDNLSSIALLPLDYHLDMGLMKLFHAFPAIGYDRFITSASSLWGFQILTVLLLFLGAIGLGTRIVIPLCAVSVLVFQGILREVSGFWHQNLIPDYVLIVLSFTPCADGWSIDRLRKIYQGRPVPDADKPSPVYAWARYACWVPIAITYAAAGFSKLRLRGLGWVSATNMRALLYEQTLYPRAGNFSISLHLAPLPDFVFVFLGVAAVMGETLFITALFSRTARRIMPALSIFMHVGIVFLQNIVFFDLMLLLLIFYDFTWVCNRIAKWLNKGGPIQILYDGSCRLCSRSVRILASADIFHRLEFQDFRRLNLAQFNQEHKLELIPDALEREMAVRANGKVYAGFEAYRVIAWALPLFWPFAPVLSLPGSSKLGKRVYSYIAGNRYDLLKCNSSCLADSSSAIQSSAADTMRYSLLYALIVAAVFAVMGAVWLNRIEYYPFTSVQMFTGNHGSVVLYYKTLAHRESGQVDSIQLEDTLPVFSINSRYEELFELCFGEPEQIALCRKTLSILGSAYNKKVAPAQKLTGLEIQRWVWDFGASPRDSKHGEMDKSFIGEIPASGVHQQAAANKYED